MTLEITPVKFEIHESFDLLATVNMADTSCAEVGIKTVVSVESWPELSAAILTALKEMRVTSGGEK